MLTRWMGREISRIHDSVVAGRKTLASLLAEENPTAMTRGGGEYHFSRETPASLGERLDEGTREALKLPVIFFFNIDVRDSCYLTDKIAVQALQALGRSRGGEKAHERQALARPGDCLCRRPEVPDRDPVRHGLVFRTGQGCSQGGGPSGERKKW